MTKLVQNLLTQLFDNEGNINFEQARNFVKVPEGANDHQVEQATYLAIAQLNLPEGFVIDHFYGFNIYTLISEGHVNDRVASVYSEELSDVLIQSVVNDDSEMLELLMKILLEESGLTDTTKGIIAGGALRAQINELNNIMIKISENISNPDYDPQSESVSFDFNRRVYDTIFNWFVDELVHLHKENIIIENSLLPHAKLILHAKAGYPLEPKEVDAMHNEEFLQAINYCETMEEIDSIVKVFTRIKRYPDVKASLPIGFIDEDDIK